MTGVYKHRASVLLLLWATAACSDPRRISADSISERPEGIASERRLIPVRWTATTLVQGGVEDTTLLAPTRMVATDFGVHLLDPMQGRVHRFAHDGRLIWSAGRLGRGPEEVAEPLDMKVDAAGQSWVLDPGNGRISVLDPEGVVSRRISLASLGRSTRELILLGGDSILVVTESPGERDPLVVVDHLGNQRRHPFPWREFADLDYLASQVVTSVDPTTRRWTMAFRLGDGFVSGTTSPADVRRGWFVEHVPFPEIEVVRQAGGRRTWRHKYAPTAAAISTTLSPTRLYVLFGGTTRARNRLVDTYELADGAYSGSYVLPEPVAEIAWYAGGLYAVQENPSPSLVYMRPAEDGLP